MLCIARRPVHPRVRRGANRGERTAAMRLKHTAPFFPAGRRAGACPGWTPGHALTNTGAPTPSVPRLQRATPRAGKCLHPARWTRLGFGLRVARLDPLARACGVGRGLSPPPRNRRAGARLPRRRRAAPCLRFPRRLPRRRADPVGRVRRVGQRLDALPRCATALRSAAERPPLRPRACGTKAARLSACFNSRPAPTAGGRRCRPVPVTPSRKRRQVLVAISHENHMAARDGITPQCRVPVTSLSANTVMPRHARYTGDARQTRPRHP